MQTVFYTLAVVAFILGLVVVFQAKRFVARQKRSESK